MPRLSVRHTAKSASMVRESVSVGLSQAGVSEDDAYDATLLVSELVGNAVRHAPPLPTGHLVVDWQIESDGCEIAVTDGGTATRLTPLAVDDSEVRGRGLAIVAALAEKWGVESGEQSTTVWAFYRFSRRPQRGAQMCAVS